MEKAEFKLDSYRFKKAFFDFNIPENAELNISFNPSGVFHTNDAHYELSFDVSVECAKTETTVISVSCVASFSFIDSPTINDIPDYFYPNSLAILFPYVRAFVSTLSLQANIRPIILPTINLIGLTDKLKDHTVIADYM